MSEFVGPGKYTGVYYILFSNLPFHTTWQQIKDLVREACPVDHVEIFPRSTSGWVRVRGQENFKKALKQLSQVEFGGRPIFTDGRNEHESILVRDLSLPLDRGGDAHDNSTTSNYPTARFSSPHPVATRAYPGSVSAQSTSSHMTSPSSFYGGVQSLSGFGRLSMADQGSPVLSTTPYPVTSYGQQQAAYPAHFVFTHEPTAFDEAPVSGGMTAYGYGTAADYPDASQDAISSMQAPQDYVFTEQRKVHVRKISPKMTENQFDEYIWEVAPDPELVESIEFPVDSKKKPKGFALVTLYTVQAARELCDKLHHREYMGMKLEVKLASEGVTVGTVAKSLTTGHRSKHRRDDKKKDKGRGRPSQPKHQASKDKKDKEKSSTKLPVIANGSNRKKSEEKRPK